MIALLNGEIVHIAGDRAVINVAGVGYAVRATPNTLAGLRLGRTVLLHTTLIVREDALTLYGFLEPDERDLFELLQTASGVGPRLAQAALAVHQPEKVRRAIASGDTATLTRIPGVGKKGAQRLVLELKDKVGFVPGTVPEQVNGKRPAGWRTQVSQGIQALGWSAKDAEAAIARLDTEGVDEADVPSLLKQAIRLLGKK
ncbi:Holliday junction branch migration protein RuvA [Natronoglycomyces albus]|uniref:Holliday junction branch migration complex subunit RuvA n=1 Tax=Natronoglycomyces albus TaxID=2811108 RepID=A0A895XNZ1_9ACTN|nr:Holliday junction branch migration protein RuvA [Natronoglycomyces albus]QSB04010.1 Holliday junction branch migration protein RuvA [Natronoglycomyces albus]